MLITIFMIVHIKYVEPVLTMCSQFMTVDAREQVLALLFPKSGPGNTRQREFAIMNGMPVPLNFCLLSVKSATVLCVPSIWRTATEVPVPVHPYHVPYVALLTHAYFARAVFLRLASVVFLYVVVYLQIYCESFPEVNAGTSFDQECQACTGMEVKTLLIQLQNA